MSEPASARHGAAAAIRSGEPGSESLAADGVDDPELVAMWIHTAPTTLLNNLKPRYDSGFSEKVALASLARVRPLGPRLPLGVRVGG